MYKGTYFSLLLIITQLAFSQSIDDNLSQEKMLKDFELFKNIRLEANSGLYRYRTKQQIDSIYNWAEIEIKKSSSYREFFNIICQLTDFEGSLHNDTYLPKKISQSFKNEKEGYFPLPLKWVDKKWVINFDNGKIPLGAEIVCINNEKIEDVIKNLYKYYTTDGVNITGKRIGITRHFSRYYRFNYGLTNAFLIEYKTRNSNKTQKATLNGTSYIGYYKNVSKRYSRPFDVGNYKNWKENETYIYKTLNEQTGVLTINDFGLGDKKDPRHKRYVSFLDSVFTHVKQNNIKNLIVDVRNNGGGNDPNDLVTYSYLTNRNFSENKEAWISFKKIPYLKYESSRNLPYLIKLIGVGKYNKQFQKEFPKEINGKFYQDSTSNDHKIRTPNKNTFKGKIYLLIGPRVASAGSLFAAMVASNENTIVIGEETMGAYYGHNGHNSLDYKLPKSKFVFSFYVVNLEQDVPKKANQIYNRGIIPDIYVTQTFEDYLKQKDTQMEFTLKLIEKNQTE